MSKSHENSGNVQERLGIVLELSPVSGFGCAAIPCPAESVRHFPEPHPALHTSGIAQLGLHHQDRFQQSLGNAHHSRSWNTVAPPVAEVENIDQESSFWPFDLAAR
jgi:hypothetical protein